MTETKALCAEENETICYICGNESDLVCACCDEIHFASCSGSSYVHQKDICVRCADIREEERNEYLCRYYDDLKVMLTFIKETFPKYRPSNTKINEREKMLLVKFHALAQSINWKTANVCSEIVGMPNQEYRRIKNLVEDEVENVFAICKRITKPLHPNKNNKEFQI